MLPMKLSTLITGAQIQERVQEIGKQLTDKYQNEDLMAVCTLNGSFMFYADLIREIDRDILCEFVGVSSYENASTSSGEVKVTLDLNTSIRGKNILLIEDIVDTGLTMNFLRSHLESKGAKNIETATLLLKPDALQTECHLDHIGFEIPDEFVVGYGLDYQQYFRNLTYIAKVENIN